MNPSILHFSRTGNAFKAVLFAAVAIGVFVLAYVMADQRIDAPRPVQTLPGGLELPAPAARPDPFLALKIPLLLFGGCAGLFYAARFARRAATREVAARIEAGHLYFHPSYTAVPGALRIGDLTAAIFDRADRLPAGDGGEGLPGSPGMVGAKLGARLRHGLYLSYRVGTTTGNVRVIDNDIDGGTEQLRRFTAQVNAWRQSHERTAHRD